MSGKFLNTNYTDTIDNLTSSIQNNILKNPYYKFSDKQATKVTYYKQNLEMTTTDEASDDIYQTIGYNSSIKYNKISDFLLYGIDKINLDYQVGDFGLESSEISGEAIILPKTIIPTSGDYFTISQIKEDLFFKVTEAQTDSLDHENNIYKITYKLEKRDELERIKQQVVKNFKFVANNAGTDFSAVLEDSTYDLIKKLDSLSAYLTMLFSGFYSISVQTFVYRYESTYFYDPYMIEFLIRNHIMDNNNKYIFIDHAIPVPMTFEHEYKKTFFNIIEHPEKFNKLEFIHTFSASKILSLNSLFTTRLEPYYQIDYFSEQYYITKFNIFPLEVIEHMKNNEMFEFGDNRIYNLLIAYLNGNIDYIANDDNMDNIMELLSKISNKEYFYLLPIYSYIINRYINSIMIQK